MPRSTAIRALRTARSRRDDASAALPETRFDRRLGEILDHATDVFCEKGYAGASMRDLSRATGMSLAGLYHYFGSKERLLYLIQKHAFSAIVEELKARLDRGPQHARDRGPHHARLWRDGVIERVGVVETVADPEQRIRIFIQNHLEYFAANQSGLKVLAHEDEALKNGLGSEVAAIKRKYYRICLGLMDDLKRQRGLKFNSRTAVMSLFGMINWIYTWYNPRKDGSAEELAHEMSDIILSGVCGAGVLPREEARVARTLLSANRSLKRSRGTKSLSSRAVRRRSRVRARDLQFAINRVSRRNGFEGARL